MVSKNDLKKERKRKESSTAGKKKCSAPTPVTGNRGTYAYYNIIMFT